jgi:hypothetical protein
MSESQRNPDGAVWFAMPPRIALPLWIGVCGMMAALVGLPVLLASVAFAVVPAYVAGRRGRGFVLPFELAIVGACLGAFAFSRHAMIAALIGALVSGAVVGLGLSMCAMWMSLTRGSRGR